MALFDNKKKKEKLQSDIETKAQNMIASFVIDATTGTLKKYNGDSSAVYIPHSVIKIDSYAFKDCQHITEVHMADSVKIIGYGAFYNCQKLSVVELSPNLEYVGTHAFMNCYELTRLELPATVQAIGVGAFAFCTKLSVLTIAKGNKWLKEANNVLYSKDGKVMFSYAPGKKETEFKTPRAVKRIAEEVFGGCRNVKRVVLPKGLARIEFATFAGCAALTEVVIPKSVQVIEESAFSFCSNVREYVLPYGLISIGKEAFLSQSKKQVITFKGNEKQWNKITKGKDYVATGTLALTCKPTFKSFLANLFKREVKVSKANERAKEGYLEDAQISDEYENFDVSLNGCALKYNGTGSVVRLPRYATEIKGDTFSGNSINVVNTIVVPASFSGKSISVGKFASQSFTVKYLEGVKEINSSPTAECVTAIELPNSVKTLGALAFYAKGVKEIHIPKGVTEISPTAFGDCRSIEKITVDAKNPKYKVVSNCLMDKETGELVMGCNNSIIPMEGVTKIGHGAFWGRQNMHKVNLPNTITAIGPIAFQGSNVNNIFIPASATEIDCSILQFCDELEEIEVDASNPKYFSKNNCLIEKDTKTLFVMGKNASIPDDGSVEVIEGFAIHNKLDTVNVPASVRQISNNSIVSKHVKAIYVDKDNEVYYSVDGILYTKESNEIVCVPERIGGKVVLPQGVTEITGFNGRAITEITLPEGVTALGSYNFKGCASLECVNLPSTLTAIGNNVFEGCASLKTLRLPAGVKEIGAFAFKDSSITDIYCEVAERPSEWKNNFEKFCNATVHYSGGVKTDAIDGGESAVEESAEQTEKVGQDTFTFEPLEEGEQTIDEHIPMPQEEVAVALSEPNEKE